MIHRSQTPIRSARAATQGTRIAALALLAAFLFGGCAPTVTETGAPGAPAGEEEPPRFGAGEVEHGAFVEPPVDPAAIPAVLEDRPLRIVATVGQITALVEAIGGDRVEVTQIVPGADDPHLYVPTPGDVAAFSQADVILYNGLFLEGQMGETFKQMNALGIPTVAVTAGFEASDLLEREYSPGEFVTDPHVWFDPVLWARAADNVLAVLQALDPAHAEDFAAAHADYRTRLAALTDWGRETMSTVPEARRVLVTSHDAFGYFGRAFDVEVKGLQGLSTEAEAGTRDVEDVASFIVERGVPAVFVEASVSPEALQAVVEAVRAEGIDVGIGGELYSDTPGPRGTDEGTYLGMVIWNLGTVAGALEGEPAALPAALAEAPQGDLAALLARAAEERGE